MPKKISIIIPTRNSSKFISECIEGVKNQTYKNWEAIFIDQMSTDNTLDIILKQKNEKFKIIFNKNIGNIASSRNLGINYSTSEFLAFLDSDDVWLPNKLEESVENLNSYDFLYHDAFILDGDNKIKKNKKILGFSIENKPQYLMCVGNPIITSTVVCKRIILDKIINFSEDKDFVTIEDYDLWCTLAFSGCKFKYLPKTFCYYRHHSNNSSNVHFNTIKGLKKIFLKNKINLNKSYLVKSKNYFKYLKIIILLKKGRYKFIKNIFFIIFSNLNFFKKIDCIKIILKFIIIKIRNRGSF